MLEFFMAVLAWFALFFIPLTPMFWVLVAFEFMLFLAFIEYEKGFWATVTMVGTLAGLQYLGGVPIIPYAVEHPFLAAMWVGGYFFLGAVYGYVKWLSFLYDNKARYDEARVEFLQDKKIVGDKISEDFKVEWEKWVKTRYQYGDEKFVVKPRASNYKKRILMWMTYWPWSGVWMIINDPVKKLFRRIYHLISSQFQKASDRVFAGVEEDFPSQETKN